MLSSLNGATALSALLPLVAIPPLCGLGLLGRNDKARRPQCLKKIGQRWWLVQI
jgi:hypothetical protein